MADDLKKIKDLVEIVVNKIRGVELHQGVMAEQVRTIRDQQSIMNYKLDMIEERQEGHTGSLVKIEATLKGYADMYKVNKEKNEEIVERVEIIEQQVGLPQK